MVYTGLRIALFIACSGVVIGIWLLAFHQVDIWALVISFVLSGVASYFLLNRQREAFARRVDERARRATSRFEEMRAREDADEPQA